MKYMLLIHQGTTPTPRDSEAWSRLSESEQQAIFRDYQEINQTPGVTPGVQMDDPGAAVTVRVERGKVLRTDGPFVETKEALGGYYLVDVDSEDEALEWAAKIPSARFGTIEVRPVVVFPAQTPA